MINDCYGYVFNITRLMPNLGPEADDVKKIS
jgi:hypothetical protein